LIIGRSTGLHITIDDNEIQAKATGTTTGQLNINTEGGIVALGKLNAGNIQLKARVEVDEYLMRTSSFKGCLVGTQATAGTDAKVNPIYCIGTGHLPTGETTLGSMYGIGYSHSNFWGAGKSTGWGLYVAAAGVVKATISDGDIWTERNLYIGNFANVGGSLNAKSIRAGEPTKSGIYLETRDQTTADIDAGYYTSGGTFVRTHLRINNQGGDVRIGSSNSSVYIRGDLVAPKKYFRFPAGTTFGAVFDALSPYVQGVGNQTSCIGTYGTVTPPALLKRAALNNVQLYGTDPVILNDFIQGVTSTIAAVLTLEFIPV
jgi:hypothetical protein